MTNEKIIAHYRDIAIVATPYGTDKAIMITATFPAFYKRADSVTALLTRKLKYHSFWCFSESYLFTTRQRVTANGIRKHCLRVIGYKDALDKSIKQMEEALDIILERLFQPAVSNNKNYKFEL